MAFIQYQQTKNLCWLYSILTAFSNTTWVKLTQDQIDEFVSELWLQDNGILVKSLLPKVKILWNKKFLNITYKVVDTASELLKNEICRWKYACAWFRFNDDIFADVVSDGVRDRVSNDKTRWWHAVTITSDGDVIIVIDNYASDPRRSGSNIFTLSFKVREEVKIKLFADKSYVIYKTKRLWKN